MQQIAAGERAAMELAIERANQNVAAVFGGECGTQHLEKGAPQRLAHAAREDRSLVPRGRADPHEIEDSTRVRRRSNDFNDRK